MFSTDQLRESISDPALTADLQLVRSALARRRLGLDEPLAADTTRRLGNLVMAVLSSATSWAPGEAAALLERAAEAAELLAHGDGRLAERARLRAALLYELAAAPMMASAV